MRLTSWNDAYDHARARGLDEREAAEYAYMLFGLRDVEPARPPPTPTPTPPSSLAMLPGYLR